MSDDEFHQIPVLVPNVPQIAEWSNLLSVSYSTRRFSNAGPLAQKAELEIKSIVGASIDVMVCSSNTSGLIASLLAFNCRGKKVLVSNYTFAATLNAILCSGATPVISEVDFESWEISVSNVMKAQSEFPDIYAVLITRVHGFIRDFEEVIQYCSQQGLPVIVDAAAAFPGSPKIYNAESRVLEVFSFHATKPLGIGEGGAVVGRNSDVNLVRRASNFGLDVNNETFTDGINAKMDEFAAARLIAALGRFQEFFNERKKFASNLSKLFLSSSEITLPKNFGETSWPFFPIKFNSQENLIRFATSMKKVVQSRRYYYPSMITGYRGAGPILQVRNLDISNDLALTTLCLPVIPDLQEELSDGYFREIERAIEKISKS
jgi:dTDP-4-amino-4,6-dideoxygalactose transaminase